MILAAIWRRHLGILQIGEHHQELVAAVPADGVGFAHAGQQALRGIAQQGIAHRVAEGIIHRLEAIEVDEQQRDLVAAALGKRPWPAPCDP
jgi:hypothetical protein